MYVCMYVCISSSSRFFKKNWKVTDISPGKHRYVNFKKKAEKVTVILVTVEKVTDIGKRAEKVTVEKVTDIGKRAEKVTGIIEGNGYSHRYMMSVKVRR